MPQNRQKPFDRMLSAILEPKLNFEHRFVRDKAKLAKIVAELKKRGLKIVLTHGVYDLVHEGHARYLEAAKEHGDVLIVGVDSDEMTRARKGPNRPVVPEDERIIMIAHLRHVDLVTTREVGDAVDLIELIRPDVLVTSFSTADFGDAKRNRFMEFCDEIVTLEPQATTSTTARIRNLTIEGAEHLAREVHKLTRNFLRTIRES